MKDRVRPRDDSDDDESVKSNSTKNEQDNKDDIDDDEKDQDEDDDDNGGVKNAPATRDAVARAERALMQRLVTMCCYLYIFVCYKFNALH